MAIVDSERLWLVSAGAPHYRGQENVPSTVLLLVQRDLQHRTTIGSMES